ncbi:HNH endonuclease [Leuconostoc citreum]|uniref:HNH endonuclease n=1 Tax=Leuconostoc citreum TaxID=33964 RepID=UPI002151D59E|nr:HNH endonuclease [Leuconostoc citreum]
MGTCQCCGNVITDRKIVDHIHPLKYVPDEKLLSDNLWLLCYQCHNIKTMLEDQVERSTNGTNKVKHISRDWYKKRILSYRTKQRSVEHNGQTNTN